MNKPKYEQVREGQKVQKGDEYYNFSKDIWTLSEAVGQFVLDDETFVYRRKVVTTFKIGDFLESTKDPGKLYIVAPYPDSSTKAVLVIISENSRGCWTGEVYEALKSVGRGATYEFDESKYKIITAEEVRRYL